MKYKIAICDDVEQDAQYITSAVMKWAQKENYSVDIQAFSSAESFLFQYAEQKNYDILLLDIEMKNLNGIELAKKIRKDNNTVQIIFITGFPDFVWEGYEVSALHYLIKPVSYEKLFQILNRAVDKLNKSEIALFFAVDGETLRVDASKIVSIEAFAHSCIVTTTHANFEVKISISNMEAMLSKSAQGQFIRCHRSYIVGIQYIKSISKTDVLLDTGTKIPLSRNHYQTVNQAFIHYFKGESQWD